MGDIATNLAGAISDGDYYTFTVTPDAGATVTFTSFSFDINKISGGADVTGTVFSSIDGFTSADAIGSGVVSTRTPGPRSPST